MPKGFQGRESIVVHNQILYIEIFYIQCSSFIPRFEVVLAHAIIDNVDYVPGAVTPEKYGQALPGPNE